MRLTRLVARIELWRLVIREQFSEGGSVDEMIATR